MIDFNRPFGEIDSKFNINSFFKYSLFYWLKQILINLYEIICVLSLSSLKIDFISLSIS
jgi:hypothetical protein